MTLLLIEGFDHLVSGSAALGLGTAGWTITVSPAPSTTTGRLGGLAAGVSGNNTSSFVKSLGASTQATVCFGYAFKTTAAIAGGSGGSSYVAIRNGTTHLLNIGQLSTGAIRVTSSTTGSLSANIIDTSVVGLMSPNIWYYIECKVYFNGASSTCEVWLDGNRVINFSGTIGSTAADSIYFRPSSDTGLRSDFDDVYVNTGTRLGDCRVETIVPNADTATADFTPSTGSAHYALVDELPANGDTDYVSSGTAGHKDLYDMTTLSVTPLIIHGIQANVGATKTDAGLREICTKIKEGGTTTNGTTTGIGTTYGWVRSLYEQNPRTTAAWTKSDIDGIQAGVEIIT